MSPALIERAATASDEPDAHHVAAAYHGARGLGIAGEVDDYNHAADVAALDMALATAAVLARRIYDHPANGGRPELAEWLHRIMAHYADDFGRIVGDLERLADNDGDPAYRTDVADIGTDADHPATLT